VENLLGETSKATLKGKHARTSSRNICSQGKRGQGGGIGSKQRGKEMHNSIFTCQQRRERNRCGELDVGELMVWSHSPQDREKRIRGGKR